MADTRRKSAPSTSSVLDDLRVLQDRVKERIAELEPFAAELDELKAQADRLGIDRTESSAPTPRRPTKAATGSSKPRTKSSGTRTGRRRRGSGESRADQVARLVAQQPGITVPALGQAMKVDSTGLYRVIRDLEQQGVLRKEGRQLQPVEGAASVEATDQAAVEA